MFSYHSCIECSNLMFIVKKSMQFHILISFVQLVLKINQLEAERLSYPTFKVHLHPELRK